MKPIVTFWQRKNPLLLLAMSCLLTVMIIFSPVTAQAFNLPIDPSKITTTSDPGDLSKTTGEAAGTTKNADTVLVFTIGSNTYTINGAPQIMDVSPAIIEDRTLLPIRFAATPLGAEVDWENETRKATVSLGTTLMELWIGQSNAVINGKTTPIDAGNTNVKPLIISDRTMLPLRFVTENLGCEVQWEQATQRVTITKTGSVTGISKIPDISIDTGKMPDIKLSGIDPGKITLKPDLTILKSDDTTVLKNTWAKDQKGKEYPVTLSEANIPVVMRVGCGYNVFDKYASVDSLKEQVLDTQKLIQAQRMVRVYYDQYDSASIEERSIKEYSESMSVNANAGGSFMGFGGSVSTHFAKGYTQRTDQYFATHSHIKKVYGVYIKTPAADNLKSYLTNDANSWLNNKSISAADVFDTFGHYVLVDTITGGRIDYSVTANSTASTSFENFSVAAKAEFNAVIFGAGASADYTKIKNRDEYFSDRDTQFHRDGGAGLYEVNLSDSNALINWENTLESRGTLVDFGKKTTRALIPVWEFCNDSSRKDYLKAEFDKINLAEKNKWPVEKYVTMIRFVAHKDKWEAQKMCPGDYQLRDINLNEGAGGDYIYLTFLRTEIADWAFPPITDLFMEYSDKEQPWDNHTEWRNHNANNALFQREDLGLWDGLNRGAIIDPFDKKKRNYVFLCSTSDKTLPPIKDLVVVLDKPESAYPGWETVCWQNTHTPANVNEGTFMGKPVYIKFRR